MRPDETAFDDEIRAHLALEIRERIERGEDPEAARFGALREFGNVLRTRESMREVWRPRWLETADALAQDMRVALRSLRQAKGLALTVVVTLALGIGANTAIFSVIREVLFRPLVNRDAERLIYIRQSAPGLGAANTTFSMAEIADFKAQVESIEAFGDFSTIEFTTVGLGEPRVIMAGVVSGSYFDVMGLEPVLGRLLDQRDDGPEAAGAVVLTHRFWSTDLQSDPGVIGRSIQLGTIAATVVGVLEPSVPYPAETEIIANVVTSPHHLSATMETVRTHRMTELFGRLASGATLDAARADLTAVHQQMVGQHPDAYPAGAGMQLTASTLRDQLAAPARPVLLALLAVAALVFVIACSNVANLILARSVRREGELAVRAALGASHAALRRTLLAESLALCAGGAAFGVILAYPLVSLVGRYAARFSVRALDAHADPGMLVVGAGLAIVAAIALAFVPKLPVTQGGNAPAVASAGIRLTPGTNRRLRLFAVTQIALSFVLLAGAGMLLDRLVSLQNAATGFEMRRVLAVNVTMPIETKGTKAIDFVERATHRIEGLPGVEGVAVSNVVPWRDSGRYGPGFRFTVDGYELAEGEEQPYARLRNITPGFFKAVGVPLLAGRDFTDDDRRGNELVVIISESLARRMFADADAVGRTLWWTEPYFGAPEPRRIVGIVADADDERIVAEPALTIYHPFRQMPFGDRLFVHTSGDPSRLVEPVKRIIREIAPLQPVERAATLEQVRTEVLTPQRLNAFVFSGFAAVAALIAVVGVAGVLAFSVSARTREFGVRLSVGSTPRDLLSLVLSEGAMLAAMGVVAGAVSGYALGRIAAPLLGQAEWPAALTTAGVAVLLMLAAVLASLMPAARASRVDLMQALRSE
jgi:putative ABC transport system permease protein